MERPQVEPAKPQGRTKIGTGKAILSNVDGRTTEMRRYKEILSQLVSDAGGDPSEAIMLIIRRAATIAVWCEQAEVAMANGDDLDIAEFTTATNALRRLLVDIGLERRTKDITPDLRTYVANKREAAVPV